MLLGGVPGVSPGRVLVLGAGTVGIQAAKMAAGLGAQVTILDVNMKRLRYVNDIMPSHVVTGFSNEFNIRNHIKNRPTGLDRPWRFPVMRQWPGNASCALW